MNLIVPRLRILAVASTILLASFGGTVSLAGAATHSSAVSHRAAKKKKKVTHHTSCITQGNVGDRDADNHGGPNDGDGCF